MKKTFTFWGILIILIPLFSTTILGQVSPYSLTPEWRFGMNAGLSFPNGNFPTSGAPSATPATSNPETDAIEASTSISDQTGAIAVYSNTQDVLNDLNSVIRNLKFGGGGDNTCAGSATTGGVLIPDPASPTDTYILFLANDLTSGNCPNKGINYYKFKKNGSGDAAYLSGPTNLTPNSFADESITAGTDGKGNYWIVAHTKGSDNTFRVWKVTSTGISAPSDQVISSPSYPDVSSSNATSKISPCQNKIAHHAGTVLGVYQFDRTTGTIGPLIRTINTGLNGIGVEFSPDGNTVYYSGIATSVGWIDVSSTSASASGTISGTSSVWSMQLGPDGKLYTAIGSTSTVGIIQSPNSPSTTSYTTLSLGSGSIFRGLINLAWLTPNSPSIGKVNTAGSCSVDFSYLFKNYFSANIGVSGVSWNFGDGNTSTSSSPTHVFAAGGPYTVNLTVTDATCGHQWSTSTSVTVACTTPVSWLEINATEAGEGVLVNWSTATERDNKYFVIQRSADGINFENIGTVSGAGNSNMINYYNFVDNHLLVDQTYYRIIQYDNNGQSSISKVVSVGSKKEILVEVQPNPTAGEFHAQLISNGAGTISVIDILGREVYYSNFERSVNFDFGNSFSKGTYFLKVISSNKIVTKKLIKD